MRLPIFGLQRSPKKSTGGLALAGEKKKKTGCQGRDVAEIIRFYVQRISQRLAKKARKL